LEWRGWEAALQKKKTKEGWRKSVPKSLFNKLTTLGIGDMRKGVGKIRCRCASTNLSKQLRLRKGRTGLITAEG